jgi:hypothetical protein
MRRLRDDNPLVAGRTVDLRSGIAGIALNVLAALRAGEFEFSHMIFITALVAKKCEEVTMRPTLV